MTSPSFDALVIGAGVGGLCAAARLAHQGYRTLVVERLDQVGGRASTHDVDGFKINNGAIVLELGGITEQTFAELGVEYNVRRPSPPLMYRIGGKTMDITGGGWGMLLSKLTRQGAKLVSGLGAARHDDGLPEDQLSLADWVGRYTKNETVHGVFRNMCGSVFAVGSEELPAKVFLTYFTRKSAFKKFGFCPDGTIGPWQALADYLPLHGGEVWLSSQVDELRVTDGQVTGAVIERDGETVEISCRFVISNAGPAATADMCPEDALPDGYTADLREKLKPCGMITVNFASERPLLDAPGLTSFGKTRRLVYVANFTATCPEMAPPGWHLYAGTSVPKPAVGDFDTEAETELLMADLRDEVPGFDEAKIVSVAVMRDDWPPQRAVAGFDLPHDTPIPNLFNVGDAVKEYANGGTTACAETAKIVVDKLTERFPR
ncbi:phytoene desaturase family protein [Pseudonocardia spinosispora]|uniref:phytoene desaturase family protein n=1 Tax=Pseudonocardia spinosispora TaxID=103441 RepID=UPI0003FC013D|nr:NAD(P)/FAD-dependent oxidoreductase [Pseudonocardia spinosispora]